MKARGRNDFVFVNKSSRILWARRGNLEGFSKYYHFGKN